MVEVQELPSDAVTVGDSPNPNPNPKPNPNQV